MTHHLHRTLSLSMLTLTLMGMGTPVVTSLAATIPTDQPATNVPNPVDPDLAPIMNGAKMPEAMALPPVPANGQPGSRIALSKDKKGYNANTRDLGGYLTKDKTKKIKPGTLFRSAQITKLNNEDAAKLASFKIGLIIDLRTPQAHLSKIDAPIGQAKSKVDSIYSKEDDDALSGGDHYNRKNGGSIAFSRTALTGYHDFLTDLLSAEAPVLYHCKHGNDRTGIATVILMSVLGMSNQDIINDYLMSNNYVDKKVNYAWLKTYFSQIDERFGGMENYITSKDGLNFGAAQQDALKAKYLVASGMTKPTEKPIGPNNVTSGSETPSIPSTVKPGPEKPSTPSTVKPGAEKPSIPSTVNPGAEKPSIPSAVKPGPEKPSTPSAVKPGPEKPATPSAVKPGPEKPSIPNTAKPSPSKPVVPNPHTPNATSKPESTKKPVIQPVESIQNPSTTYTRPKSQKSRKIKVKIFSIKKIKHAKFVHLKSHRAYFFDLHLKHKVGTSGKTGLHPKAKWKMIKRAKISVNGKLKNYIEVQSPHGKKRWILLKDVLMVKPNTHHVH
ncbi:tyrosine-protein phosphatase [Levilactobacillus andaensis]|uniref:tyrosine-protein phosphatase n=1 Tax=Levilactobacillus andaensis TaxID=2799570 RepID=UPI001944C60A|nr:tyrosine-protein phosphatase [Levilactobacillus andaensis]